MENVHLYMEMELVAVSLKNVYCIFMLVASYVVLFW